MPYRIDLFAIFIFLGVVQAVFLSLFFFSKESRKNQFNVFHGLMLLSIAACLLEIFLMYSGYIVNALHLVDFSETFGLLIGPFLYLYVFTLAYSKVKKHQAVKHLLFPIIYTLAFIPFIISPIDVKYNAWINSYHPNLALRPCSIDYDPWMFVITEWHIELVLISLGFYTLLSSRIIFKSFREKAQSFWKPETYTLRMMRDAVLQIGIFSSVLVVIKLFNKNDTGDHLFAAFAALLVYATSFSVVKNSNFFRQIPIIETRKYKGSAVSDEQLTALAVAIQKLMQEQKLYRDSSFSLPMLAELCKASIHTVSQAINEKFGKNFFEWMAEYRVEEAKLLLTQQAHIKIEEIAERVGYNAKSSFNAAFKKITGQTPSEFRSAHTRSPD